MRRMASIILLVILGIGSLSFITNLAGADTQFDGTWVHMRGIITQWGSTPVYGLVGAFAGMVDRNGSYHEWAMVHAIWSADRPRLNCSGPRPPPENFTFTLYAAKLVNSTEISLNHLPYDFYILGTWNVIKITTSITFILDETEQIISIDFHRESEAVVTEAPGELCVVLNPQPPLPNIPLFELSIEGIDPLRGFVALWAIKHVEIKICDIDGDGKVDLIDLVRIAKRFRTVPGLWNYEHHMDFNFNNEIDIGDVATVAANIEG
jgi:hypothetical protein